MGHGRRRLLRNLWASLAVAAPLLAITSQSMTATLLGIGPLIAIVLFATAFPDTHGRELEEITGEDIAIVAAGIP